MWLSPNSLRIAAAATCLSLVAGCNLGAWRGTAIPAVPLSVSDIRQPIGLPFQGDVPEILPADVPDFQPPPIVSTPEKNEVWNLTLHEALSIAFRNSDVLRFLSGQTVAASPATAYDPGIAETRRIAALAAFDAQIAMSYVGNRFNQPSGAFFGPGISQSNRRDDGDLTASVVKPWITGGQTRVAFNPPTGYLYLPDGTSGFNPKYAANVELSLVQPLLRNAGSDVNQAPIWVAQLTADQSIWDVKQSALALVRSVEEAYWGLQAAHAALRALDDVMPLIDGTVHIQKERLAAERIIRAEFAKARAAQAAFREQRIDARSSAIAKELQLRNLIGLPPSDGRTIVPVDPPSRAPLVLDGSSAVAAALDNRPDIIRQRIAIRIRELQLLVARNLVKPQLDLQALYRTNGLGQGLDDALSQMFSNHYTDWTLGATFSIPLGNRAARVNAQGAELQVQREQAMLRQSLHATAHVLSDLMRQIEAARLQYDQAEIRLQETNVWLDGSRARYEDPPPGGEGQDLLLVVLNDYLLALRSRAEAATDAASQLATYNTLLARLDEAKGTLLAEFDIHLQGDPVGQLQRYGWPKGSAALLEPITFSLPEGPPAERP